MNYVEQASEYLPTIESLNSGSDAISSCSLGDPMKAAPEGRSRTSSPGPCFHRVSSLITSIGRDSPLSLPLEDGNLLCPEDLPLEDGNLLCPEDLVIPSGTSERDEEILASPAQPSPREPDDSYIPTTQPQQLQDILGYDGSEPIRARCMGIPLLSCCSKVPSLQQVSACVTGNAPCFWCCSRGFRVRMTDRAILYRLNLLCAFFAVCQIAPAVFLLVVLAANLDFLSLWNLNTNVVLLGALACVILITTLVTLRTVQEVNIRGSIIYLWTLLWVIPLQIFLLIGIADLNRVTHIWIRHWWATPGLALFRRWYCGGDTYNSLCIVPVGGNPYYDGEEMWCLGMYNQTNCAEIRNAAQSEMTRDAYIFYYSVCGWALLDAMLLLLIINMLETIITRPIVQQSREANIPRWMLLPTTGCFATGFYLSFSASSITRQGGAGGQWIGFMYMASGVGFFTCALLGGFIGYFSVLNSRDQKIKQVALVGFIGTSIYSAMALGSVIAFSIIAYTYISYNPIADEARGSMACSFDTAKSCSYCGNRINERECPEWTADEVTRLLQSEFKLIIAMAVIFFIYAISATRYGILVKKSISLYQIDYV